MPGAGRHTAEWDRCVAEVEKKGTADNPYSVCTATLGPSIEHADAYSVRHARVRAAAAPCYDDSRDALVVPPAARSEAGSRCLRCGASLSLRDVTAGAFCEMCAGTMADVEVKKD